MKFFSTRVPSFGLFRNPVVNFTPSVGCAVSLSDQLQCEIGGVETATRGDTLPTFEAPPDDDMMTTMMTMEFPPVYEEILSGAFQVVAPVSPLRSPSPPSAPFPVEEERLRFWQRVVDIMRRMVPSEEACHNIYLHCQSLHLAFRPSDRLVESWLEGHYELMEDFHDVNALELFEEPCQLFDDETQLTQDFIDLFKNYFDLSPLQRFYVLHCVTQRLRVDVGAPIDPWICQLLLSYFLFGSPGLAGRSFELLKSLDLPTSCPSHVFVGGMIRDALLGGLSVSGVQPQDLERTLVLLQHFILPLLDDPGWQQRLPAASDRPWVYFFWNLEHAQRFATAIDRLPALTLTPEFQRLRTEAEALTSDDFERAGDALDLGFIAAIDAVQIDEEGDEVVICRFHGDSSTTVLSPEFVPPVWQEVYRDKKSSMMAVAVAMNTHDGTDT